jgi:hypothetical protein
MKSPTPPLTCDDGNMTPYVTPRKAILQFMRENQTGDHANIIVYVMSVISRPRAESTIDRMLRQLHTEGLIVWNGKKRGEGCAYSAAAASGRSAPPAGAGAARPAPRGGEGIEGKLEKMTYVRLREWWKHRNDEDSSDYLPDSGYLRWLLDNGCISISVTPYGRQWAGRMRKAMDDDDV